MDFMLFAHVFLSSAVFSAVIAGRLTAAVSLKKFIFQSDAMKPSNYPAFLLFHDWQNCFAYTRNASSQEEIPSVSSRVRVEFPVPFIPFNCCHSYFRPTLPLR